MVKKVRSPKSIKIKTSGQATRPTRPNIPVNKEKVIKKPELPGPDEINIDDIIL